MPKLQRSVILSLCVASLVAGALACNLLAEDKFKIYVDGGCDFGGRESVCGVCIAQECGGYVAKICGPTDDGDASAVLKQIEACAKDPRRGPDARASSPCLSATAAGASDQENQAFQCVAYNCINVPDASCAAAR